MPRITNLQIRKGTSSEWSSANPTLDSGEPGLDTTNNLLKIGNGQSNWSGLSVVNSDLPTLNVGNLNLTSSNIISLGDNKDIVLFPTGNVGISTNFPIAKLHVYSSNAEDTILNIEGTNGSLFSVTDNLTGSLMSINNKSGLPVFEVFSDDKIIGGRFGQNDFVLTTTGNVGIGTASASEKLEVSGNFKLTNETASTLSHFDSNKNIKSLSTETYPSLTELSYVKGVTSAIQTQIDNFSTGSTSITTLGTVTTGTWNAGTIAITKGGTGATDAATARSNLGLSSTTYYNLLKTTTDGTPGVVLTTNGSSPSGTTNLVVVNATSVWIFTVNVAAYNTTDNAMGAFQIRGAVSRNGNNTTSIVGSTIKEYFLDSNMTGISADVVAEDSNETLQVKVTGLSSKTIKWTATIAVEEISTA